MTIDTAEEAVMNVHIYKNEVMTFYEMPNGLYCHDTDTNVTQPKTPISVYSSVNIVECNLTFYTRCE